MSIPCGKSELLLFDPVSQQICMDRAKWVDVYPLNPIGIGPIEFNVYGTPDTYIDTNDTMLYVSCRIKPKDAAKKPVNTDVAPVNNMLHSLFSDVTVDLNDKRIEGGSHMYAYKSYLSSLLNYGKETKNAQLIAEGFIMDESGKFDSKTNKGHVQRSTQCADGVNFELSGPLNISFFQQSKYLLPGVNIRIKLLRNKPEHCVMNFGDKEVLLEITRAVLYMRRVQVSPTVMKAHEDGLLKSNAIYPVQRCEVTNYTLSKGSLSDSREILISSDLPKLLVVCFVENDAYNGSFKKNPFNLQHYNVQNIALIRDGQSIPSPALEIDFKNKVYMRAYMQMVQNLELFGRDISNGITPAEFADGSCVFVYNLTPDLNFGAGCSQKFENTNLRLDLKFSSELSTSINVILFCIYDSQIEISRERTVWQW